MNTYANKTQENKNQSVANAITQKQGGGEFTFKFVDNRTEAIAQLKLQAMANNSSQVKQLKAFQEMANNSPHVLIQRQVHGSSDDGVTPWDLVGDWVNQGMFDQFAPTISREEIAGGGGVSVDYDIEFAWNGTYFYDGQGYTVRTHLHVRNGVAVVAGGGIWVTGLVGQGGNWNTLAGHNDLLNFMTPYVE